MFGVRFPYLGILGQKHLICDNCLSLKPLTNVIEGILEVYEQGRSGEMRKMYFLKIQVFGARFPYLGILGRKHLIYGNLSLKPLTNVIEGILEQYGQGRSGEMRRMYFVFENLGFGARSPYGYFGPKTL